MGMGGHWSPLVALPGVVALAALAGSQGRKSWQSGRKSWQGPKRARTEAGNAGKDYTIGTDDSAARIDYTQGRIQGPAVKAEYARRI